MNRTKINGIEFKKCDLEKCDVADAKKLSRNDTLLLRDIATGRIEKTSTKIGNNIVLTVPHSYCLTNLDGRTCDTLSLEAANDLEKYFEEQGVAVTKFTSTIPRYQVDLNREEGQGYSFRPLLTNFLLNNSGNVKWFIDVHSFPNDKNSWGNEYANIADLVILDNYSNYHPLHIYLRDYLKENGFSVAILTGNNKVNDINREVISKVRENVLVSLLEFNESLSSERLNLLSRAITFAFDLK